MEHNLKLNNNFCILFLLDGQKGFFMVLRSRWFIALLLAVFSAKAKKGSFAVENHLRVGGSNSSGPHHKLAFTYVDTKMGQTKKEGFRVKSPARRGFKSLPSRIFAKLCFFIARFLQTLDHLLALFQSSESGACIR